jgi:hypothetical protein
MAATRNRRDRLCSGRTRQAGEFVQVLGPDCITEPKAHEYCTLTCARTFKHALFRIDASIGGGFGSSALFDRETYSPSRHNGGYRVFVNHLTDGVLEEHDKLVERVDLALQFDAVDEIDRNRNVLLTQRVQKWVLQRLTFGHEILLIFQLVLLLMGERRVRRIFRRTAR